MRWYKCDLQMQTPADFARWQGAKCGGTPEEVAAAAEKYIRACYAAGLEVIAVTDHNFLSKSFIPELRQAVSKLSKEFGYSIVIFPGFEFEANVGKGVHVLAIFEPDADLDAVDHKLTTCGVSMPREKDGVLKKSTRNLVEILRCVQSPSEPGDDLVGLVILPHLMSDEGLFDNDKVSNWLQQYEFLNPELLAVEVNKPVGEMNPNFQKLFRADDSCAKEWRRERPIACISSSDCKAYSSDELPNNYIGWRSTWIKMSSPSIEALRQAFLDHASRVRLQDARPSDGERHPHIISVSVRGTSFLADQEIHLSSNLNCVIGGRGSGKSTLLEYLRFCLQPGYEKQVDKDVLEKLVAIRRTLSDEGAEVRVKYSLAPEVEDTVVLRPKANQHVLDGRDVQDLQVALAGLKIQFFSQGELSRFSQPGHTGQVLELLDAACGDELDKLESRERQLRKELESLFALARQAQALEGDIKRVAQEITELTRQLEARKEVQADAVAQRRAGEAADYIREVDTLVANTRSALDGALDDLATPPPLPETSKDWPHSAWFGGLSDALTSASGALKAEVAQAIERYEHAVRTALDSAPGVAGVQAELEHAAQRFIDACEAKGVSPADAGRLRDVEVERAAKQRQLDGNQASLKELSSKLAETAKLREELTHTWQRQFALRQKASQSLSTVATSVQVRYMGDELSFKEHFARISPRDSRTRLARHWEDLAKQVYSAFQSPGAPTSPWNVLLDWLNSPETAPKDGAFASIAGELKTYLNSADVGVLWESVQVTRVADYVDVELRRSDGSVAGTVSGGGGKTLSEGQRNTALLSLILANGDGPLVVDQPEDELDSSFIFSDLVPQLREAKNGRQLILATHNANVPVNADAELVYAFDAHEGRGVCRAAGGLDRQRVTRAVLDIMEGSEKAFRQRSEKYHF